MPFKDLTGRKFNRLTVLERDCLHPRGHKQSVYWICVCECGEMTVVSSYSLTSNYTKSCGCLSRETSSKGNSTHGMAETRIYGTWCRMKSRCANKNSKDYEYYGGRGVVVCKEWLHDFQAFYDWAMANGYQDGLTIDRIDVNGNYEPSNCRWVTMKIQNNNTRSNHLITYKGKTQTMKQWSEETGINYDVIRDRINKLSWNAERALTTPAKKISRR